MGKRQPIRVILAEDHRLVRQGLRALLERQDDLGVAGEAEDGAQAIDLAVREQPDVVVMDLAMPGLNGVEATRAIRARCPETAVLCLSMHASEEYVRPAIRAGATGYLLKGSDLSDLISAIRAVARGDAFFSPEVARLLIADVQGPDLTTREREVLRLVARGASSSEAATALGISAKTVEGHRGRIMAKLGIHDLAGLVRYAVRTGLVSADD